MSTSTHDIDAARTRAVPGELAAAKDNEQRGGPAVASREELLAGRLVDDVLARHGEVPVVLDAQSYLVEWYGRFGFVATGPEFLEDGIPHTPMRREPR